MSAWIHGVIDSVMAWLTDLGYWGIMFGLMIEIIPSEIVLAFGGYLVSAGQINYWLAVLFGTVGGVLAQIFVYWIGLYGGRPVLERFGKYIFINKHHIEVSENWFNKYGSGVIFTARFIPVVRHAISVPAGMARMPLSRFTLLTTLAVIPWSMLFVYLGMTLGENWSHIDETAATYTSELMWGALGLTALYAIYVFVKRRRRKAKESTGADVPGKLAGSGRTGEDRSAPASVPAIAAHSRTGAEANGVLAGLPDGYRALGARIVRSGDSSQTVDQIVIGPNGIFHVEFNDRSGELRFRAPGHEAADAAAAAGDLTANAYRSEYVLKDLLRRRGLTADVVGIICFTDPEAELSGTSAAFEALKLERLVPFIVSYRAKHPLDEERVRIAAAWIEDHSGRAGREK
jgi:membrane protein DedA with SNARE-associated domain